MHSPAPQIGFDRFIKLEWAEAALRVRAGASNIDELDEILSASHSGSAAKRKTRTVLNRLWLEPSRPELVDLADRAVALYQRSPDLCSAPLVWGMALATYPFFGKVAEIVGRLTALQGECTSAEIHRRMSEIYGQREGTKRMTNMVLQSQESWGGIDRLKNGKMVVRKKTMDLSGSPVAVWLTEACLRCVGGSLPMINLSSSPIVYPFILGESISYLLSQSSKIELSVDGSGQQVARLNN